MKLLFTATLLSTTLCSTLAPAQAAAAVYGFDGALSGSGCPVAFAARRTGALTGLLANEAGKARAGAGFHLSLQPAFPSAIRSAEVMVHAVDSGPRVLPAADQMPADRAAGREFSRSFHLTPRAGSSLTYANVWLTDAAVLRSAELVAIEYRDGTTWHRSHTDRCVAVPDLLVLTSAH